MRKLHSNAAFSLVEITLALGIAAFTLISIFGLLPVGLNTGQAASTQTTAANLTTSIVADLRQVQLSGTAPTSAKYTIPLTNTATIIRYLDEAGTPQGSASAGRFRATVTVVPPAANTRTATYGTVRITWPSVPDPDKASGSLTTFFALDRN